MVPIPEDKSELDRGRDLEVYIEVKFLPNALIETQPDIYLIGNKRFKSKLGNIADLVLDKRYYNR